MTEDEKVKIRKDAKDVIASADAAREALLIWINQGSGDLASKAYAIKSRVKDENSLVRKVMYKIEQDKKSRYTAYKVANKTEIAQTALHEADRLLKTDRTIPPDHILRVTIPRQYSLMLWLRKQEIWFSGNQKGEPRFRSSDQIQILRRCLRTTRECMIEMKHIQSSAEKAIEEMRLFNNQISYVWELKDLGERADLSAQEKCAIKKYLPNLDAELVQPEGHGFTRRMSGIDSALKASTLLGDAERIEKYRMLMLDSLKREKESPPEQREFTADELGFFEYSLGRLGAVAKGKAKKKARSSA